MTLQQQESIQDKLFRLKTHGDFIEDIFKNHSDDEVSKDSTLYYSLEHMLQLSIQIILDIGAHILAEEFHENPQSYAEVITSLGKHGIVNIEFATTQSEMAKFRNKLVHDYGTIVPEKVVEYGRTAPGIFRTFGQAYVDYMGKKVESNV
jgi:uncharacterized protein YutE (UPF0331/DUF86 family)